MLVAHYVGDHAKDDVWTRAGWAITRAVQKGPYGDTTHCEAIHAEHGDGSVTIASSSLRDGGVRDKQVRLNPLHWRIVEVPFWDVRLSIEHLAQTRGQPYDLRGAVATAFIGSPRAGHHFCNHWVSTPFVRAAATFGPHHFHAITLSMGRDVTEGFFRGRA